jgi:hypothetical protein
LAKFKVYPDYLRHAHLPEVLVSTKRGAPTLAEIVAKTSNNLQTLTTMLPPAKKRKKQHINPTTKKGYSSPFLPWISGPKRQPRIPKTAAQERLASSSADRSPSPKSKSASGGTAESPIIVDETETHKKSPSSSSPDKPASSGTGLGKTPGTGSRSNHEEQERKSSKNKTELFQKQKKMLRSIDATRQRRPEKKKTETTRKQIQADLETRRKIKRRRRNLADQIVDLRSSISSLVRRKDRKPIDSITN